MGTIEQIPIRAIYKNGTLIPQTTLSLKENEEVDIFLNKNYDKEIYDAFTLAGEDSEIDDFEKAQFTDLKWKLVFKKKYG